MRAIRYAGVLVIGLVLGFALGFIACTALDQMERQGVTLQEDAVIYSNGDPIAEIKKGATFYRIMPVGHCELWFDLFVSDFQMHQPIETYYSDKQIGITENLEPERRE